MTAPSPDPNPATPIPGARFRYIRGAAAVGVVVAIAVVLVSLLFPAVPLRSEKGPIEIASWLLWFGSAVVAGATVLRHQQRQDRWLAFWMMTVALLALLRELDAHVWLNPEHFGQVGVRYRLDWWLDANVSLALKLGWAAAAIVLAILLAVIPLAVWLPWLRMTIRGIAMVGLFILHLMLMAGGFLMDDLLRGVTIVTKDVRSLIEETSEMLGALVYVASTWLRWPFPLATHVQSVAPPGAPDSGRRPQ